MTQVVVQLRAYFHFEHFVGTKHYNNNTCSYQTTIDSIFTDQEDSILLQAYMAWVAWGRGCGLPNIFLS
jgi:hypothetical protein